MTKIWVSVAVVLLMLAMSVSAFAHTGPLDGGEPPWEEIEFTSIGAVTTTHNESIDNPDEWYKGWWFVNLTNRTSIEWDSVIITPGVGDLVALVQGNGLEDEWGFVSNSIMANKAGDMVYSGYIGDRIYDNGAYGLLWGGAQFNLATPLAYGESIGLRIYTDNSYYEGPYAESFSMTITPVPVPEPSSMLALMGGAIGLAGFMRRRK